MGQHRRADPKADVPGGVGGGHGGGGVVGVVVVGSVVVVMWYGVDLCARVFDVVFVRGN